MAPSYYDDDYTCTSSTTDTSQIDSTVSVSSASCTEYTITSTYSDKYYYEYKDEFAEEKLLKLEEKIWIMEGWLKRRPEFRPIKLRPSVQLRGVRLDGRGWA